MATVPTPVGGDPTSRVILLISLALNLFFLGLITAGPVRHLLHHRQPLVIEPTRSAAERIDRLAGTLPADDADNLRAAFRTKERTLESAHAAYRKAQESRRGSLRAEPFDVSALRSAMADLPATRQSLDTVLQDVIAAASTEMSPAGRNKLADGRRLCAEMLLEQRNDEDLSEDGVKGMCLVLQSQVTAGPSRTSEDQRGSVPLRCG
jgi:uncharacterized membrane protein